MTKPPDSGSSSALFRIAGVGAALGFGAMVASLFALKLVPDGFSFELNLPTVIAFFTVATFAWFYWRLVARLAVDKNPEQQRKKFITFSVGLLLIGVVGFLYPLRFIPPGKRSDVFIGLACAVAVLSGVGMVMWKVKKFLDADLKRSEEEEEKNSNEL